MTSVPQPFFVVATGTGRAQVVSAAQASGPANDEEGLCVGLRGWREVRSEAARPPEYEPAVKLKSAKPPPAPTPAPTASPAPGPAPSISPVVQPVIACA